MPLVATGTAVAGPVAYLLVRLIRDATAKPIYEDEALAGLISARPVTEIVETVMGDRGGAPLHFLLAHVTLALDPSLVALRALSIVFAVATVVVCYDLGRRLGGTVAGVVAALIAASSDLLLVYGSFGRMYALFAFAAALAADLFVRAAEQPTARAAAAAALAALLLPAAHPYGIVPFAIEAAVALALWRGRPLRPALPALAIALGVAAFLAADLRLADRFSLGLRGEPLAHRQGSLAFLEEVLRALGGGTSVVFFVFLALALAGLAVLAGRSPAFAAVAGASLTAPAVVLLVTRTGGGPAPLSPRYFVFVLPVWAALIGVGAARGVARFRLVALVAAIAAVGALAVLAPGSAVVDPRVLPAARQEAVAAPAAWLREHVGDHDVLFPYSAVYLAALPETAEATVVSRARPDLLLRELDEANFPVRVAFLAVPTSGSAATGAGYRVHRFGSWLLLEAVGPFADRAAVLRALQRGLSRLEPDAYVSKALRAVGAALAAA